MEDTNKAEKLAAAKRKLKKFQQKGISKSPVVTINSVLDTDKVTISEKHAVENGNNSSEHEFVTQQPNFVYPEKETNPSTSREMELQSTVEILIAEKNELSINYSQAQEIIKRLTNQLNEEKEKSEKLETSLDCLQQAEIDLKTSLEEKISSLNDEIVKTKEECREKSQLHEEVNEELKELQVRYSKQSAELKQQHNLVQELNSQIDLLTINMQQLKNAGPPTVDQSLEKLQKEQGKLLQEISEYKEQVVKLTAEKDILSQQYQQYILRLNGQIRTLSSQNEAIASEKRNLEVALELNKERAAELETLVTTMQKERENWQQRSKVENVVLLQKPDTNDSEMKANVELQLLEQKVKEMTLNNDQLSKLVLEKESRIQELQIRIDRLQNELSNSRVTGETNAEREKLIQAMQNDKTAASRAIAQNRKLKIQLEELEKAFIHLSNDKLQLTEQLQTAVHQNRELDDKIQVLEPELNRLRQEVGELAKQKDVTIYWRQELEEAHERIHALTHQNNELKKRVIWNLNHVQQFHDERNESPVNGQKEDHTESNSHCEECKECHTSDTPHDENHGDENGCVSLEEYERVRNILEQLEKQFQRTMEKVAILSDEKQKLEHLVLQLQGETETIGEYVSLYQIQRGLLRKRAQDLALERETLKKRISRLTYLLPYIAPKLESQPQWSQLVAAGTETSSKHVVPRDSSCQLEENETEDRVANTPSSQANGVEGRSESSDRIASSVVALLSEIMASNSSTPVTERDPYELEEKMPALHENFHPCLVCSGRLLTV